VTPDKSSSISTPDQCCHACFFLPNPYAIFFSRSACYFIPPNAILVASCTQLTLDFHHPSTWPVPIKRPSFCTNTGPLVSSETWYAGNTFRLSFPSVPPSSQPERLHFTVLYILLPPPSASFSLHERLKSAVLQSQMQNTWHAPSHTLG
jgi:hypothetical protein